MEKLEKRYIPPVIRVIQCGFVLTDSQSGSGDDFIDLPPAPLG